MYSVLVSFIHKRYKCHYLKVLGTVNTKMDKILQTNFQKVCRTCLIKKDNLQAIYRAIDLLKECTSIQIEMEDDLPKLICIECTNKLNIAFEFRKQCEVSQKILIQLRQIGETSVKLESDEYNSQLQSEKIKNVNLNSIYIKSEESYNNENNSDVCEERNKLNNVLRFAKGNQLNSVHEIIETCISENKNNLDLPKTQNINLESINTKLSKDSLSCNFEDKTSDDKLKIESDNSTNEDNDISIRNSDDDESIVLRKNKCIKKSSKSKEKKELKVKDVLSIKTGKTCPKCNKFFELEADLEIHKLKHQKFDDYVCPKCSKCFETATKLKRHLGTHMINKPYKCHICNKSFIEARNRNRHLLVHKGDKDNDCFTGFQNTDKSLRKNEFNNIAIGTKNGISCPECEKFFELKTDLEIHLMKHKKFDEFNCPMCSKSFENEKSLKRHFDRHMIDKPYKCNLCDKTFVNSDDRNRHLRIHTGEKPYICPSCGKRFTASNRLSRHMKYHIGVKNFVCTVCSKTFMFAQELRGHMRTHTGEKPFLCTECGQSFSQLKGLKVHKINHTGERPFSCTECDKTFTINKYLKEHMRSHTGEKPHVCKVCGVGYTSPGALVVHNRTHTGERPYACDICEKTFKSSKNLSQHKRTHNKIT